MPVDTLHAEYEEYDDIWERCRDVIAGEDEVKDAATDYLPQPSGQDDDDYEDYKTRAMFYNATGRTLDGLVGMVFRKDPEVEAPDELLTLLEDVTLSTVPIEVFAQQVFQELVSVGRVGILVDMQTELVEAKRRPYLVSYPAEQIINWRTERRDGDQVLSMVVLKETYETAGSDEFEWENKDQYRVLSLIDGVYTVRIFQATEDGKAFMATEEIVPKMRGSSMDFIPFWFIGPDGIAAEVQKPPLLDLVNVNLSHYRSSADLESGRYFTGHPQPWLAGFPDDTDEDYVIGGSTVWVTSNPAAKAEMLEFTGQGLQALESALTSKEKAMAALGARLLEEQKREAESADALKLRQSGEQSVLSRMAKSCSIGLTQAIKVLSDWAGTGTEVSIELNNDFVDTSIDPATLRELIGLWQAGGISFETLYSNLMRGEIARAGISSEEERKQIDSESLGIPSGLGAGATGDTAEGESKPPAMEGMDRLLAAIADQAAKIGTLADSVAQMAAGIKEQKAPTVVVAEPGQRKVTRRVNRDQNGNIVSIEEE